MPVPINELDKESEKLETRLLNHFEKNTNLAFTVYDLMKEFQSDGLKDWYLEHLLIKWINNNKVILGSKKKTMYFYYKEPGKPAGLGVEY